MPPSKKFRPVVTETPQSHAAIRGRGASWSPANRFEKLHVDFTDVDVIDAEAETEETPRRPTQYFRDGTKSIITRNTSPDVGFETSLNPYRGCEHGCIYCYARPTHEYLGFSAGLDFESKIMVKTNAAELLQAELESPRWQSQTLVMSGVTDPYQPIESKLRITRDWLEEHFPDRKEKVLGRIRDMRGTRLNNSQWHTRMTGEGVFAEQIASLFRVGCRHAGIGERPTLSTASFRKSTTQLCLKL